MAYATIAVPSARHSPAASAYSSVLTAILLLVVATVLRAPTIGDPLLGMDEDFYLLVGDRMWQGALPYVDIFDRKPIGLFLLYAAFRPFSSDGVVAYQVGALLFATATAFVVVRLATRLVALPAAVLAGVIYLLYLPVLGGAGGQSPVFYNLFMAAGALVIVKSDETEDPARRFARTIGAMLLVGVAMEIKTSVVMEGAFFGSYLMYRSWSRDRHLARLAVHTMAWLVAASAPTALAAAFYVLKGHGDAFVYAIFQSALTKKEPAGFSEMVFFQTSAITMTPILLVSLCAAARLALRRPWPETTVFVLAWSVVSIAGFFAIGHYYKHYALPTLLPLSVLSATLAARPVVGGLTASLFILWSCLVAKFPQFEVTADHKAHVAELVEAVGPYAEYGCIYVNVGPTILYLKTRSCLPTPLVFPEHLSIAAEAALGRGQTAMAKLIAGRPSAVLFPDKAYLDWYKRPMNAANQALLAAALAKDYLVT